MIIIDYPNQTEILNFSSDSATQGVAYDPDGLHYYVSWSNELRKYLISDNSVVWTVNTQTNHPPNATQTNGIYVYDGHIYAGYLSGGAYTASGIVVFTAADGTYVRYHDLLSLSGEAWGGCEGGAIRPGTTRFFAVSNRGSGVQNRVVREMQMGATVNDDWTFVADYITKFEEGVTSAQGSAWLVGVNEEHYFVINNDGATNYTGVTDVYRWTGSGFDPISRIVKPKMSNGRPFSEGIAINAAQTEMLWMGEFSAVTDTRVHKTPITRINPAGAGWPNALNNLFGANLELFLRLDDPRLLVVNDTIPHEGKQTRTVTVKEHGTDPVLPKTCRTAQYQSFDKGFHFLGPNITGVSNLHSAGPTFSLTQPFTVGGIATKERNTDTNTRGCLYSASRDYGTGISTADWLEIRESPTVGKLVVTIRKSDGTNALSVTSTGTPFTLGARVFWVVTFNGTGTCRIYINGAWDSTHTVTTTGAIVLDDECFGSRISWHSPSRQWPGYMDELFTANQYVGTTADITDLYDALIATGDGTEIPHAAVIDAGFVLISPADTTSGLTKPVTLTWTAVVEATHYRLEIAETADTDFASPVKSELLETNEYSITDLPAAWYRWRVRYRM